MVTTSKVTLAIIPAAGLGTRLLSATKEQPKEMLSVFTPRLASGVGITPVVQLIFEQLHDYGFREFCFVVGRCKRIIKDHFTPDIKLIKTLHSRGNQEPARDLLTFYRKLNASTIFWQNQPEPRGFGDAVLRAKGVADGNPVLVHAGDNYVISRRNNHLGRLLRTHHESQADATLLLRTVEDPRNYGVAEVERSGKQIVVTKVTEKPERPASKLALLPVYAFNQVIFSALESIRPGKGREFQLTDAVQELIDRGLKVRAVQLKVDEFWLDVGTPQTYWQALRISHDTFLNR